jgi:hypothetical protein
MTHVFKPMTCFEVARTKKEQIPQFLVNDEFSTSTLNVNDICDTIKAEIILKKYSKKVYFPFNEKIYRETEKTLKNHKFNSQEIEDDEFVYFMTVLQYHHSFVCKLVGENMDEIKSILKENISAENSNLYEKYYDYSYIVNSIWRYRCDYAKKIFKNASYRN